jgi:hypothetical protein
LLERIAVRPHPDEPVIITGDFNAGEDNPAMLQLIGESAGRSARFVDTFRVIEPGESDVGTFTGFELGETSGPKTNTAGKMRRNAIPGCGFVCAGLQRSPHLIVPGRIRRLQSVMIARAPTWYAACMCDARARPAVDRRRDGS